MILSNDNIKSKNLRYILHTTVWDDCAYVIYLLISNKVHVHVYKGIWSEIVMSIDDAIDFYYGVLDL